MPRTATARSTLSKERSMDKTRNYLSSIGKRNITDMTDIKKFDSNAI